MSVSSPAAAEFVASGMVVIRTPLLPFTTLTDWAQAGSRGASEAYLRSALSSKVVDEAVLLASPVVHEELQRLRADDATSDPKLLLTMGRYFQRMASRPTPFGLFAGCAVGRIGARTKLQLEDLGQHRRHARLDHGYLFQVAESIAQIPAVADALIYHPNSSLYLLGGRWRYVHGVVELGTVSHRLLALDADNFLSIAVERARGGVCRAELIQHLVDVDTDGEITVEDASDYVSRLIEWGILTPTLTPLITGGDALNDLCSQLAAAAPNEPGLRVLQHVAAMLNALNESTLGTGAERYQQIESTLRELPVPIDRARLFQVDLAKRAQDATLGEAEADAILDAIIVLHSIAPRIRLEGLRQFREAYVARYEQREMPLLEVLDEESGIGFDRKAGPGAENSPLLNGLRFASVGDNNSMGWTPRDGYLLSLVHRALQSGSHCLELRDDDIAQLRVSDPFPLPDAFAVVAVVARTADGQGWEVLVRHSTGPAGANLLGRFCHTDPAMEMGVREHLESEEALRPTCVFAEIVHLPEGRLANVLARPALRRAELVYLGRSGLPVAQQIPASDLLVSIRDDRIRLRSRRLGAEVMPRMANAHTYSRGLGVYKFLCALQTQGSMPAVAWQWGALESCPFLPRVTYRGTALTRKRWRLSREQILQLIDGDLGGQKARLQEWRSNQSLPRFVGLVEGDNEMTLDFDNDISAEVFLQLLKRRDVAIVTEMWPSPAQLAAHGPEGAFVHELVVPYVRRQPSPDVSALTPLATHAVQRSFLPGSRWLFLKWYAGTASVDDVVATVARRLIATSASARWFFIRYGDPQWHLRLRIEVTDASLSKVLAEANRLSGELHAAGILAKLQVDTYEREIERYGGAVGIELSEALFWHDSESALEVIELWPGDEGMDARWRACLLSWDQLLDDLELDLAARRELMRRTRDALGIKLRADKRLHRALGDKFRKERTALEGLFEPGKVADHPLRSIVATLKRRSARLAPIVADMKLAATRGELTVGWDALAAAYLHMNANRLLRADHQPQEFVLSDFLFRIYDSRLARGRKRS